MSKKQANKKPKEYNIQSFEDFLKVVNEKNVDLLCGNFYGVIKHFLQIRKIDNRVKFKGFTWIDDGKLEIKKAHITLNIIDK